MRASRLAHQAMWQKVRIGCATHAVRQYGDENVTVVDLWRGWIGIEESRRLGSPNRSADDAAHLALGEGGAVKENGAFLGVGAEEERYAMERAALRQLHDGGWQQVEIYHSADAADAAVLQERVPNDAGADSGVKAGTVHAARGARGLVAVSDLSTGATHS